MANQIFLPLRRQDRLVMFERRDQVETNRSFFHAVGEMADGRDEITLVNGPGPHRQIVPLFREIFAQFPALDEALGRLSMVDLAENPSGDALPSLPGLAPLETAHAYIALQRDLLVADQAVRLYRDIDPPARVEPGRSGSVYNTLLRLNETEQALRLIAADLPIVFAIRSKDREWAYLFSQFAEVCKRGGDIDLAVDMLDRAIAIAPEQDHHLRRGNMLFDTGKEASAIAAYQEAAALGTLPEHASRRLANWRGAKA